LYWTDKCYLQTLQVQQSQTRVSRINRCLRCGTASASGNVWIWRVFVCGIVDNSVRRKLLQEPKLSLEKCLDICRSAEATSAHLKAISGQLSSTGIPADNVNAVDKRKKSKAPPKRRSNGQMQKQPLPEPKEDLLKPCKHCRRSHVKQRTKCPAFGKLCSACNKPNHFAEMCRSTSGKNS